MSILESLSSAVGDKTEEANRRVAAACVEEPDLLGSIAQGMSQGKGKVVADCAEVLTMVAQSHPELVVPYVELFPPLFQHKTTKVRWEAMHAFSLLAERVPEQVEPLLPQLREIIMTDKSTIVRDYAIEALGYYAKSGEEASQLAYSVLLDALPAWEGKHRGRVLNSLASVAEQAPSLRDELAGLAERYLQDDRPVVKKAAKGLRKAAEQV